MGGMWFLLGLKITKPTLKKEGDSAVDPGLISPKLLIKPGPREERRREDRMREEKGGLAWRKWAQNLRARETN